MMVNKHTVVRYLCGILLVAALVGALAWATGAAPKTLTFAVFGDCRPAKAGAPYLPVLSHIAAHIVADRPDFVIGTGDYILGSKDPKVVRRQYQDFFRAVSPLKAHGRPPVYWAAGNHDIQKTEANEAIYRQVFGKLYYSFDRGPCHFIILNTDSARESGRIAGAQLQWLQRDLQAHRSAEYKFICFHQPLYPVDGHMGSSLDAHPTERDALHQLFVRYRVTCCFMGHEHEFNQQMRDKVRYIITGGAGAPLYLPEKMGGFYHYLLVTVNPVGYHVQVKRVN